MSHARNLLGVREFRGRRILDKTFGTAQCALFALFSEPLTANSRLGRMMSLILAVITKFLKRLEQHHANLLVSTCIKALTGQSEPQSS